MATTTNKNVQRMVVTAVMLALAAALSMVKIFKMPLGGSVTLLSMLPVAMVAIQYGARWGFAASFLYALIQLALDLGEVLSWGLTPWVLVGSIVFDYMLAFAAIGCAGLFRKKGVSGICAGIALGLGIRFISHFISGSILFASWCPDGWNVVLYSICYNGAYMLPEMAFTMVAASVLFKLPQVRRMMAGDAI